ncbi:unnamed protein product [Protopolystoma xenopodis]|uniref:Uncharacterized protein n=1 Tax=Protopolystoma xenopodis TaxID=117903 RepID=A0A3S5CJE7_9PLAT|nr:unnamed protein product [Protopolystoma xenopodis]
MTLAEQIACRRSTIAALDARTAVFRSSASGALSCTIPDAALLLARARFADLESGLGAERERLRASKYHLEDFNALISTEKSWLARIVQAIEQALERKFATLEEVNDEIDALEKLSDEHKDEDDDRLSFLTKSLVDAKVLADKVNTEMSTYERCLNMAKVKVRHFAFVLIRSQK